MIARGPAISPKGRALGTRPARGAEPNGVGSPDVMVQPGSHLATYFSTEAGRLRIAVPFHLPVRRARVRWFFPAQGHQGAPRCIRARFCEIRQLATAR